MTEFERLVIEKLGNLESKMDAMESEMQGMKNDISALKKTAIKVETELIPKTQLMIDSYMGIANKVNISNDIYEEVKVLRYEVDLLKKAVAQK